MKPYKPEQIVTMLRQMEVSVLNGKTTHKPAEKPTIIVQTVLPLAEGTFAEGDSTACASAARDCPIGHFRDTSENASQASALL